MLVLKTIKLTCLLSRLEWVRVEGGTSCLSEGREGPDARPTMCSCASVRMCHVPCSCDTMWRAACGKAAKCYR